MFTAQDAYNNSIRPMAGLMREIEKRIIEESDHGYRDVHMIMRGKTNVCNLRGIEKRLRAHGYYTSVEYHGKKEAVLFIKW